MSPVRGAALMLVASAGALAAGFALPGAAGAALLYPVLGVVPGLVVARLLPVESGPVARLGLALAAAPLVTSLAGWALLAAGVPIVAAARLIAGAALALAAAEALRRPPASPTREEGGRFAVLWAAGAGLMVALPLLINPYLQIRSDSWIHAGITHEILERGVPPEDPRYAGLPLNYVWFFNLFLALAAALGGDDPFVLIPFFNAATLAGTLLLAWLMGRRLWGVAGAKGCAILAGVGFNAAVWILWPLRLVRALVGDDRGWPTIEEELSQVFLRDTRIIWTLTAPFASMASFLDKFLIGTAVASAYLLMLLHLWAWLAWLAAPRPAALAWMAAAAAGMLLFHGVVGLSYVPVALATCAACAVFAARWPWLPDARRLTPAALATALGALAAAPYTLSISRGWAPERSGLEHRYLAFDPWIIWTLASALLVAGALAWGPLRRGLAERRGEIGLLALLALGLAAFTVIVKLPLGNHVKFVYETYVPVALLGGAALGGAYAALHRRVGRAAAAVIAAVVLGGHVALTFFGYYADPHGRTSEDLNPSPAERRLYAWARAETPRDAVFLDRGHRSRFMVRSGRQLWLGTPHGPELAAFPAAGIRERNAVMDDLYGPLDRPAEDIRSLTALGRPIYVLYRAADDAALAAGVARLDGVPAFRRVYDRDGFVVYHLSPPANPGVSR